MSHKHVDIESWMKKKGLTIQQAAERLGVSASYIYYILEGKREPGRKMLSRMAEVGIDPNRYLGVPSCK